MNDEAPSLRSIWAEGDRQERPWRESLRLVAMVAIDDLIDSMLRGGWRRGSHYPLDSRMVICWNPGGLPFMGQRDRDNYTRWWMFVSGDVWPDHAPVLWREATPAELKP